MNSVPKFAKKALSSVVVSSTILWSMGASMIVGSLTANAAAADGSLIKAKEFEAVYYLKGGKRFTFPNLKTYKSWFADFKTVQTVTLSELQSYPLQTPNGNVVYRAGTRLVKITTDPKVYAVTPNGQLRWVKDEATAKALWGNNWAKMVDDVPDAFFTNYSVGADISTAVYPDGSLLKSGSNYYYIEGGMKRMVDSAALIGNGFNTSYAVAATDVSSYADGTAMGAADKSDVSQGAVGSTSTPTTPVSTGSLTIATASDTPAAGSIVVDTSGDQGGQQQAGMLKFTVTATGGDAVVTEFKATRLGVSKDGDIDYVYLADKDGKVLAKNNSLSLGVVTFVNSAGLFTVPAGTTATMWLLEDVNKSAAVGSTQGWSIDASSIKLSGSGTATGSVSGSLFTVASITDLGQLEFASSSPISGSPTADAGRTDYLLGTFKVAAKDQQLAVKKLALTQIGTVNAGDIKNLKIKVAGVQYDGVKAQVDGNKLSFDLTKDSAGATNADNGLTLLAGQTKFIDIYGDIVAGTNRTFRFSIQNTEDLVAYDTNYKVNAPVADWGTDAFAVESLVATTINTVSLTMSLATDSPNTNVASGGSNVLIGKFNVLSAGEDAKFSSLTAYFSKASSDTNFALKNVKLLLNGVQVGSTVASSTALGSTGTTTDADFTFSNNFIVKAGVNSVLEVRADLTDSSVAAADTVQVTLSGGTNNVQGTTSLTNISSTAVSGNTLTVKSGAPTVVANNALPDYTTVAPTGVLNDSDVKIGSFVVSAGAGEGSEISSIQLVDTDGATANTVGSGSALNGLYNKLRLQVAGANIAPEIGTLSAAASTYTFNLTTPKQLAKGEQMVVDVVANILSTTSNADISTSAKTLVMVKANGVTYRTLETGQSGTAPSTAAGLQKNFIVGSGALTAAVAGDTPVAQQYVLGSLAQPLFKFKLTASTAEDIKISELVTAATIKASAVSPTSVIRNIVLLDDQGKQVGATVAALTTSDASATTATSTAYAKFSSLSLTVPKNTSKTFTVAADFGPMQELSGTNLTMYLENGYDQSNSKAIVAIGGKSGTSIATITGITNNFTISSTPIRGKVATSYKTKISVAHASNAPSGASSWDSAQIVGRFVISNTSNVNTQAATINLFNPTISTSISAAALGTATRAITIYKGDGTQSANQIAISTLGSPTSIASACMIGPAHSDSTCPVFSIAGATGVAPVAATGIFSPTVAVESGSSQVFTITMDTTDAASTKSLTVGIGSGGINWTDGYTANITSVDTLPLLGKTLTYN